MHLAAIALKLHRMGAWLEQVNPYPSLTRQQFDGPPFGCAHVTMDPTSTKPAASFNRNRIYLCGRSGGLSYEGLTELINLFTVKGVKRLFVWLSAGPEMDAVREWLGSAGLERVVWTRYPTLALNAPADLP